MRMAVAAYVVSARSLRAVREWRTVMPCDPDAGVVGGVSASWGHGKESRDRRGARRWERGMKRRSDAAGFLAESRPRNGYFKP